MARSGWKILFIGVSSDVVILEQVTHSFYPAGRPAKRQLMRRAAINSETFFGDRHTSDSLPDRTAVRAEHKLEPANSAWGDRPTNRPTNAPDQRVSKAWAKPGRSESP